MYPFKTINMYMYFLNCMYADAFVFIQGKIWALRPNSVWGKCFVCSRGLTFIKIFLEKIKQPFKTNKLTYKCFIDDVWTDVGSLVSQQAEKQQLEFLLTAYMCKSKQPEHNMSQKTKLNYELFPKRTETIGVVIFSCQFEVNKLHWNV